MQQSYSTIKIILLTSLFCNSIYSQNLDDNDSINQSKYYTSLHDNLLLRIYGTSKASKFKLVDNDSSFTTKYSPNENFKIGLGFNYKWLGFGLAFNIKPLNNDDSIYGKTENLDLQLNTYTKKWTFDANLSYYSGYFYGEIKDYKNTVNKADSVLKRPDITTFSFGGSGFYAFKYDKFSYKASFIQNEWQKKSAGSFLIGGFFSFYGLDADSSLILPEERIYYSTLSDISNLGSLTIGFSFGYAHTLVYQEKCFLSLTLLPGISLQTFSGRSIDNIILEETVQISSRSQGRIALGYNSEKSFAGISVVSNSVLLKGSQNVEFSYEITNFRIFYGRRF